jgi:hypothetical protein
MGKKTLQELIEEDIAAIEAAEADQTDAPLPPHVKVSRPGHARSKVLQVRLNPDEFAAIEAIAERRELPASTVARAQLLKLIADDEEIGAAATQPLVALMAAADRVRAIAGNMREEMLDHLSVYMREHNTIPASELFAALGIEQQVEGVKVK